MLIEELSSVIKDAIRSQAQEKSTEEICGLLVYNGDELSWCSCRNSFPEPDKGFLIHPKDYLKAIDTGAIAAIYHSHPDGENKFSPFYDKTTSLNHKLPIILYHLPSDSFQIFNPDDENASTHSYLGRSFQWGVRDCFTLVVDFFKNELDVDVIDNYKDRNDSWARKLPNIDELFLKDNSEKFYRVDFNGLELLEEYDLLVFRNKEKRSYPTHIAIYLGNATILHQLWLHKSSLDKLIDDSEKNIDYIVRCRGINE